MKSIKLGSCKCKDIAILAMRIIVGVIFVASGWSKVVDMTGTVSQFSQMGLGSFLAYFVSYAELIGGIFLIIGFYTQIVSIILGIIMIGASLVMFKIVLSIDSSGIFSQIFLHPIESLKVFIGPAGYPVALLSSLVGLSGTGSGKHAIKPCKCCSDKHSCN